MLSAIAAANWTAFDSSADWCLVRSAATMSGSSEFTRHSNWYSSRRKYVSFTVIRLVTCCSSSHDAWKRSIVKYAKNVPVPVASMRSTRRLSTKYRFVGSKLIPVFR